MSSSQCPLVSVIIPVFNGERFLAAALQSVEAQQYRPLELLVVDDGSEDGTSGIAAAYPGVRYLAREHEGVAAARNAGIAAARGKLIAFLDCDDLWMPDKLRLQVDYLLGNPHVGCVAARQRYFLEPDTPIPFWLKPELLGADQHGIIPSALVVRRAVFERVGLFDTRYEIAEDSDWIFRARDAGIPFAVVPHVLVQRRVHDANLSSRTRPDQAQLLAALKASIDRRRAGRGAEGDAPHVG